jgi:hypothetical protein
MEAFLGLVMVILMLIGAATVVRAVPRSTVRRVRQVRSDRTAVEHLVTDRLIRENEHELFPDREFNHLNCEICGPGPLYRGMVPSQYKHPFYKMGKTWKSDGYSSWEIDVAQPSLPDTADMVSSLVVEDDKATGTHTVMLDIDLPARLVESSTPGHYHLYIDQRMRWGEYKDLLKALHKAGLIETGFYDASLRNHATMLRPPWVRRDAPKPVTGKKPRHRHFNIGGKA